MTDKLEIDEYLAKAAYAENLANTMTEAYLRGCWRAIADGYRELAQTAANKVAVSASVQSSLAPPSQD